MVALSPVFSRALGVPATGFSPERGLVAKVVEGSQSIPQPQLEDVMRRVSEVAAQINKLGHQVETRFRNDDQFQCKGHEKVIGHFHLEKKAHKRGEQEANRLQSHVENRKVTYKVIHKDSKEYKKYSEDLNFFEKRMRFQYVTVVTQYHHDNKIGCSHYTEWLKAKDITQY